MPSLHRFPFTRTFHLKTHLLVLSLLLTTLFWPLLSATETASAATSITNGFDSPFGMNVHGASRYMAGPGDDYSTPFNSAQGLGIGWTREELGWDRLEPRPGQWNWGWADTAIKAAQSRNLQILILLNHNVDRSSGGDAKASSNMPDLGQWGNYVNQVVSRYSARGVHYFQVWNEPQDPVYFNPPDPNNYARLLATSYDIIKRADPQAKVLTAGFVPVDNGIDWMNQLLNAGGRDKFDILAVHPYVNDPTPRVPGGSMAPERAYWSTTDLNQAQNFAVRAGNKPIWATEFGWNLTNTGPGRFNAVSAGQQANYLIRSYAMGLGSGIQKFFVYQFHDDNINPSDRYGLVGTDWRSQKPGYSAYRNMVTRLTGATPQGRVDPLANTSSFARVLDFNNLGLNCANSGAGQSGNWSCFASSFAQASASSTTEQTSPAGGQSLKINYNFRSGTNDRYVTFYPSSFPQLGFNPTRLGFWMLGDGNRTELRLIVKDSAGQTLTYDVGRMGPASSGWQRYEAQLIYPKTGGNAVAYPIKGMELLFDGWPKNTDVSGTVYLSGLYAESGPPAYIYRYLKGGQAVDVAWADGASATISLPTKSAQATLYTRDGQAQTITASNGLLSIPVSDSPVYVEHTPAADLPPGPPSVGPDSKCSGPGNNALRGLFDPTWQRYDEAITSGRAQRSWIWGPEALQFVQEAYDEAPGGCRTVLYWDKSRMEITNPSGNRSDKYFVTNGLLARELIGGQIQLGNNHLVVAPQGAAQIPAAGDSANNPGTPTYAAFARVTTLPGSEKPAPNRSGALVNTTLDRDGNTGQNGNLNRYNVHLTNYVAQTQHNTADVFWQFMNSQGPIKVNGVYQTGDAVDWIYSIGLPLSEPYWANVTVGGKVKDVLIQAFERRVLTYTPSNSAGFQVEMGNIGRHYLAWRYNWQG